MTSATSPTVSRPVTRLRLLLPELTSSASRTPGRVPEAVDVVAKAMADALATMGVQTRLQLQGSQNDGSPRSDVALWLPDLTGATPTPDPRQAPARVHIALVVDPTSSPRTLARYDALLVPFERLLPAVKEAAQKSSRPPAIVSARLCGQPPQKDAERVERGLSGRRVVVVDVRSTSALAGELERTVVQLALRSHDAALVLVTNADDAVHKRLRELCLRHAVDAWLATGDGGLASTLGTADVVFAAPSWDEVLLCGLYRTPLSLLQPASGGVAPLSSSLRDAHVVDDVIGTLQLAAAIDRRLADVGAAATRGLQLQEALFSTEKVLYDAFASVEPLPGTHAPSSRWELLGPHAERAPASISSTPVAAVDPARPPPPTTAQKIEDDLALLKARLKAGET